jgi:putative ABC transport system substrate-binding protein
LLPEVLHAQRPARVFRIGYIGVSGPAPGVPDPGQAQWEAFRAELQSRGFVEGQNYVLERRWVEGRDERIPQLVAELLDWKIDILIASHSGVIRTAKQVTKTIPIVMAGVANPERTGLVESLARPGGNVTGVSNMFAESAPKIIELFKEALPTRSRLGVVTVQKTLGDLPASVDDKCAHDAFVAAARTLRVTLIHESLAEAGTIDVALTALLRQKPEALYVNQGLLTHRVKVGEFAMAHRLPLFTRAPHWPSTFLAFGVHWPEIFTLVARRVADILNGAKPADLPVEQPTKHHVMVSLRVAKALGITLPPSLLLRADEVIE